MSRALSAWSNGVLIGHVTEQDDIWAFEYTPEWMRAPEGFDLSPALSRAKGPRHLDGASLRPVQWYFDNLLPEERMRDVLAKEASINGHDAFGLLAYFGAESAGSLVLLDRDTPVAAEEGLVPLELAVLSKRIQNLPVASLSHDAPKKMSLAGAQHKLLVVLKQGQLFEPLGGTPSTHILKPQHQSDDYPSSVINEYFAMRLAKMMGLDVPHVERGYVPEPVYLIERFDRQVGPDGQIRRLHVIDTCQLLNKSLGFKYKAANVEALQEVIKMCRGPAAARQRLFEWLTFNVLIGNGDNHLKNISFMVDKEGIRVAPTYDLLSTAAYETRAIANDRGVWPQSELAFSFGQIKRFSDVTRDALTAAGLEIGLGIATVQRLLDRFIGKLLPTATELLAILEKENARMLTNSPDPERSRQYMAADQRILNTIVNLIVRDMIARVK